jgi:hypothetical protein
MSDDRSQFSSRGRIIAVVLGALGGIVGGAILGVAITAALVWNEAANNNGHVGISPLTAVLFVPLGIFVGIKYGVVGALVLYHRRRESREQETRR